MNSLARDYIIERMNTMFEKFFKDTEEARKQLLEGAITYEEFFNKMVALALDLAQSDTYNDVVRERQWQEWGRNLPEGARAIEPSSD